MAMSKDELYSACETIKHIREVQRLCNLAAKELITRGEEHDASKLEEPEAEWFAKHTKKLAALTFGTEEYAKSLEDLKPALEHHYANNRHHPEHFPNGVDDMNLFDVIEMLLDWKAASQRQNNGNILKSILKNSERYGIGPQLAKILQNTIEYLDLTGE